MQESIFEPTINDLELLSSEAAVQVLKDLLLGDNEATNLYSYFNKYIENEAYKKPLSKSLWKRCCKFISESFCACCCHDIE